MRKKWLPWITGIFAAIFVLACVMIFGELSKRRVAIDDFRELAALIEPSATQHSTDASHSQTESENMETQPSSFGRNLQPLFEKNADCLGWICIEGTAVNYPVMHTPEDPEKYLHKNFDRKYSAAGVPFLDADCEENCDNLIVYAHNMKNGTMFANDTMEKTAGGFRIYRIAINFY